MKHIILATAAASLLLGVAGEASAQPRPYGEAWGPDHRGPDQRGPDQRGFDNRGGGRNGGGHDWRRGGRIDRSDWNRGRRVDYRAHKLRRPPRGYEWREVDGNYILAAAATGVIADLLLNHR